MNWIDMIAVDQIRKLGSKSSQFGKNMVDQTENRFLPYPFPKMETETTALSCFLGTGIYTHVCASMPVSLAVFKRVGSRNILCCVSRWYSCLHCKLNCCQSRYTQPRVGCIWLELWEGCPALFVLYNKLKLLNMSSTAKRFSIVWGCFYGYIYLRCVQTSEMLSYCADCFWRGYAVF